MRFLLLSILVFSVCAADDLDISFKNSVLKGKNSDYDLYLKEDGTEIKKYKSHSEHILHDGTIIKKYLDGKAEYLYPDGKRLYIDRVKAERKYKFSDGSEKIMSMTGKTPYGELIAGKTVYLNKNPEFELIYSAEKSDDIFENDEETNGKKINGIKAFFEELQNLLKQQLNKKENTKQVSVEVSFCRFSEYGYCYNREKRVTVEVIEADKIVGTYSFPGTELKNPDSRIKHAEKALIMILGLK